MRAMYIRMRCRWLAVAALVGFAAASARPALAQVLNAQIQGLVLDADSGKGLAGATVVVSGPAVPTTQAEITDAAGRCLVAQLPPGDDYVVSIYYGGEESPRFVQAGVRLSLGKTLTISAKVQTRSQRRSVLLVREHAPSIDTASATQGAEINQELLRATPVRGRTFESALALAPGVADAAPRTFGGGGNTPGGEVGVSISGATGAENAILIDGINTTDPSVGTLSTQVSQYFLREINVLTGGYQAEYGRAGGGVVSLVTKSGSSAFHGGVYGTWQPVQAPAMGVARLGEALLTRLRDNQNLFDLGVDLGGPLWRDRIWFYGGFAVTAQYQDIERRVRRQIFDPARGGAQALADFACPRYLSDPLLCDGPRTLAYATEELPVATPLQAVRRLYNGIAKLQFNLHPDHRLTLTYLASPATLDSYYDVRSVDPASVQASRLDQVHDVSARYVGNLLRHKLQLELSYAYHYQRATQQPAQPELSQFIYNAPADRAYSLADFEDVPDCRRQDVSDGRGGVVPWNPCPVTSYRRGYGFYRDQTLQRHQLIAAATFFFDLLGQHAVKAGFDFEHNRDDAARTFSGPDPDPANPSAGHRVYQTDATGTQVSIALANARQDAQGNPIFLPGFVGSTSGRNYAVYLRDSWNVRPVAGLVLNIGLRWEGQEILAADGSRAIGIFDNIAPRVGAVFDFTRYTSRPGRGKLFFNYGRYYQSVPLDIADRLFTGEGFYVSGPSSTCATAPLAPGGQPLPVVSAQCQFPQGGVGGGTYGQVVAGLKGMYTNEIVAGINYDLGRDFIAGLSYVHRDLGNIIEDLSVTGGSFFFVGNPGAAADPKVVSELQAEVAQLQARASSAGATDGDRTALQNAQGRLAGYLGQGALFPPARRDYNAVVLTLSKRLSNRLSLLGSYTYSRTIGNYPGLHAATSGQLNPNNSTQFDLIDLLANRSGPLPSDRPHNFKLTGFYVQPLRGDASKLTVGLTFTAISGRPIEVLGAHALYGTREVSILPRGSGGRTPTVTQFDLRLGYDQKLGRGVDLGLFADVINLFDQQAVINVDDEYTVSVVSAIPSGRPADLRHLRDPDGNPVVLSSNYGQPTAFQSPLYLRLGGRLTF